MAVNSQIQSPAIISTGRYQLKTSLVGPQCRSGRHNWVSSLRPFTSEASRYSDWTHTAHM